MIPQLRDKKQIARRKNLIRNTIVVGLFLVISISGILVWSGKLFVFLGRPILNVNNAVSNATMDLGYLVKTKSSIFNENEILKKENSDLNMSMIDYQVLKKENNDLKELLSRLPEKQKFTLATILAKPNRSPYDTIIVDVGSSDGVLEHERVFANANIPIGEVSKVYSKNSLIILYSNPGQITEAVMDGSNASVELIGRGGGNFEMTIPNDLTFDNSTMILLPGIKSEIVATIDGVISRPTDPIKKVILRSPINIQSLKWVQIERN